MRIRYVKTDPRRGTVVELDERAARAAIDRGEAEEVSGKAATTEADKAAEEAAATTAAAAAPAPAKRAAKKTVRGR